VSNLLYHSVAVGDRVTMSPPFGDVVLDDSGRPVVFVSAGIGITPMAGMLSHLVAAGSGLHVTVLHADVDEASWPLRQQILADVRALPNGSIHVWFERGPDCSLPVDGVRQGLMDLAAVSLAENATYYLCGPVPFMQAVRSSLIDRDVAAHDIKYEVFGPDLWQGDLATEPTPGAATR